MLGLYIIDEHGDVVPCEDTLRWGDWLQTRGPVQVARTILGNGLKVSTIFLAIDHGYSWLGRSGPPLLFETIIFLGARTSLDEFRYPDWERAAAHHVELVAEWGKRQPNE